MSQTFRISFDIPLKNSKTPICLKAVVELDASSASYKIYSLGLKTVSAHLPVANDTPLSMTIESIEQDGVVLWVNSESGKETLLSRYAGYAIENHWNA